MSWFHTFCFRFLKSILERWSVVRRVLNFNLIDGFGDILSYRVYLIFLFFLFFGDGFFYFYFFILETDVLNQFEFLNVIWILVMWISLPLHQLLHQLLHQPLLYLPLILILILILNLSPSLILKPTSLNLLDSWTHSQNKLISFFLCTLIVMTDPISITQPSKPSHSDDSNLNSNPTSHSFNSLLIKPSLRSLSSTPPPPPPTHLSACPSTTSSLASFMASPDSASTAATYTDHHPLHPLVSAIPKPGPPGLAHSMASPASTPPNL